MTRAEKSITAGKLIQNFKKYPVDTLENGLKTAFKSGIFIIRGHWTTDFKKNYCLVETFYNEWKIFIRWINKNANDRPQKINDENFGIYFREIMFEIYRDWQIWRKRKGKRKADI